MNKKSLILWVFLFTFCSTAISDNTMLCKRYKKEIADLETNLQNNAQTVEDFYRLACLYFMTTNQCPGNRINYDEAIEKFAASASGMSDKIWQVSGDYFIKEPFISPYIALKFLEEYYKSDSLADVNSVYRDFLEKKDIYGKALQYFSFFNVKYMMISVKKDF
ncbi:MAG: hypothetical protein ABIA63_13125, partial [bacterium]